MKKILILILCLAYGSPACADAIISQGKLDKAVFMNRTVNGQPLSSNVTVTTISGNAGTATKLAAGRVISITGPITYTSPAFDGSTNITAASAVSSQTGTGSTFVMDTSPIIWGSPAIRTATSTTALSFVGTLAAGEINQRLDFADDRGAGYAGVRLQTYRNLATGGQGLDIFTAGSNADEVAGTYTRRVRVTELGGVLLYNIPVYADNTAAASLTTGTIYRTSTGTMMIKY